LATPMSVMVGIGRGAQAGVLIRDAATLEALQTVDTLAVDKTGTLTEGKPRVVQFEGSDEALRLAASLEQASEHPLASAVVAAAVEKGLVLTKPSGMSAIPGHGVAGIVEGREVSVGNEGAFVGVSKYPAATFAYIKVDRKQEGWLAITDPIKES